MKKRVHAIVHGRVQGVFFREYTRRQAEQRGLNGWVRNLPDGTVETIFEGDESTVTSMVEWLSTTGSPMSTVTGVNTQEEPPVDEPPGFTVRF